MTSASAGGRPKAVWSNNSICCTNAPYNALTSKSSLVFHRVVGALDTASCAVVPARLAAVAERRAEELLRGEEVLQTLTWEDPPNKPLKGVVQFQYDAVVTPPEISGVQNKEVRTLEGRTVVTALDRAQRAGAAIHTTKAEQYGELDHGKRGIYNFFATHECTGLCAGG